MLGPASCSRYGVNAQIARAFGQRQHLAIPRHAFGSEGAASRFPQYGFFLNMHFSKKRLVRALPSLAFAVLSVLATGPVCAQVTIPEEYAKLIKHRGEITAFGNEGFGDKVDFGSGGLQIVQTDVDLPGNNALPVRVSRRFVPGDKYGGGHFGVWSLDIPYMHGIFANHVYNPKGWTVPGSGAAQYLRCAQFSAPPELFFQTGVYAPDEYWQGSFFHLPGGGDQELLSGGLVPTDGNTYPITTKDGAAVRCVALASTSQSGSQGDGFEVVTPDGLIYTLNQMVSRPNAQISKRIGDMGLLKGGVSSKQSANAPPPQPNAAINFTLPRVEVLLYPTKVTDRFGNYVTYTWSATNPWQLTQITASDGRQITLSYPNSTSIAVSSVSDGSRTWTYGSSGGNATVTLPDGSFWSSNLSALFNFEMHTNGDGCTADVAYTGTPPILTGSVTSPSGATALYTMTPVKMGRSWVPLECVADDGGLPIYAREPAAYWNLAVTAKKITGPGLPVAGIQWTYAYGPANGCFYPGSSGCTTSSPTKRTVSVTDSEGAVTRYTFGNRYLQDEGLLLTTEAGWNGTSALRKVDTTFADMYAAPYYAGSGYSPRQRGDAIITGLRRPQRKVVTTQQGRDFIWEVASNCPSVPYCFDIYARPTKVVKSSVNP